MEKKDTELKARKKEYDKAVPMLQNYIKELGKENKVHLVIELLDIYLQTENMKEIAEILDSEAELLPYRPQTPQKHFDIVIIKVNKEKVLSDAFISKKEVFSSNAEDSILGFSLYWLASPS
ncbi:hypothetical protein SAMN04487970_10038 [Paenibacillus tianmuensis]|uniref:Uncharacterized protein n=1 Tax=Paenibacillus tianmuensis TaxID=624147 RepID=A0A1G4PKK0_9BACL|nr:hypothetical protein SAMN04487970_10038 [Paenibacillus tianmuensis]